MIEFDVVIIGGGLSGSSTALHLSKKGYSVLIIEKEKFQEAKKYSTLSYQQVLSDEIAVMDSTAIALCKDNNIPIMVFDIFKKGNISKAVAGDPIGSLIS